MKVLGMIGGTGPESTVDYYRLLLKEHARRRPGEGNPPILINSVTFKPLMTFLPNQDWVGMAQWLAGELAKLQRAGADFGLISANTPHLCWHEVAPISPLPLLSIVEAAALHAQKAGHRKLGLLGTKQTMSARIYPETFGRHGLQVATPTHEDQAFIDRVYFEELFVGVFREETRDSLAEVVHRLVRTHEIDAVILGGTELPLILREAALPVPALDTARIHCVAAVDWMLS